MADVGHAVEIGGRQDIAIGRLPGTDVDIGDASGIVEVRLAYQEAGRFRHQTTASSTGSPPRPRIIARTSSAARSSFGSSVARSTRLVPARPLRKKG